MYISDTSSGRKAVALAVVALVVVFLYIVETVLLSNLRADALRHKAEVRSSA